MPRAVLLLPPPLPHPPDPPPTTTTCAVAAAAAAHAHAHARPCPTAPAPAPRVAKGLDTIDASQIGVLASYMGAKPADGAGAATGGCVVDARPVLLHPDHRGNFRVRARGWAWHGRRHTRSRRAWCWVAPRRVVRRGGATKLLTARQPSTRPLTAAPTRLTHRALPYLVLQCMDVGTRARWWSRGWTGRASNQRAVQYQQNGPIFLISLRWPGRPGQPCRPCRPCRTHNHHAEPRRVRHSERNRPGPPFTPNPLNGYLATGTRGRVTSSPRSCSPGKMKDKRLRTTNNTNNTNIRISINAPANTTNTTNTTNQHHHQHHHQH